MPICVVDVVRQADHTEEEDGAGETDRHRQDDAHGN